MGEYEYKPCEGVDPVTMKPNGNWHFCCITTSKMGQPLIFPLGYCRKDHCVHKTAQEAADCYRKYELDHDIKKYTGEDFTLPNGEVAKGRNEYSQCRCCGRPCKSFVKVGLMEVEYYLCEEHLNREEVDKLHPQYTVNAQTK